jgi:hypothetical protein
MINYERPLSDLTPKELQHTLLVVQSSLKQLEEFMDKLTKELLHRGGPTMRNPTNR